MLISEAMCLLHLSPSKKGSTVFGSGSVSTYPIQTWNGDLLCSQHFSFALMNYEDKKGRKLWESVLPGNSGERQERAWL